MTPFLGNVERLLERAFEAPARGLFRTRLQPVELARAVGRAMVADSEVGPNALQVPNHYVVELHPDEFRRFVTWREALERDLARYVLQQVQRRGWHCTGWPKVEVRPADTTRPGRVRVATSTVDRPESAQSEMGASHTASPEGTAVLAPPASSRRPASHPAPRLWVDLADGRGVELAAPTVRVGRALDNDVVLDHESVSRYHAELRRHGDQVTIVDLGSTNGTRVAGRPVQARILHGGETIHVGAVPIRFRVSG